jgi:GTP cyclohydrolase II/3,4-dihydroxy 2-butanone 4-phosphate synthase/GTP cyclohydrolase II
MITLAAKAKLPTLAGYFDIYAFNNGEPNENAVIVKGDVAGKENVPVRIHSECLTGDVFGSKRCWLDGSGLFCIRNASRGNNG